MGGRTYVFDGRASLGAAMRVVLMDTLADALFRGSTSSEPANSDPQDLEGEDEPCPETLRSGVFPRAPESTERPIQVTMEDDPPDESG
jgi:hypothetical protein